MTDGTAPRNRGSMLAEPLSDVDLVALSDIAWQIVDPDEDHDFEEHTWTALLRCGWPPLATVAASARARVRRTYANEGNDAVVAV